jgi:colanic acid biosynthesis glycosyl transferase WcaI
MRILVHSIFFAPVLTGVGKYSGEMSEWLVNRGHDVRVVTAPPYYPYWRKTPDARANRYVTECWQGIRVFRCPLWVPARPGGAKRLLHLATFAASSLPVMMRQVAWRPDVVIVVQPTLLCAPAAWLLARASGARAWLHVQDYEVDAAFDLGILRGETARRIAATSERRLMREFDRVSTISHRMLELARDKGVEPHRLVLFPNWVDVRAIVPACGPNPMRDELGIDASQIVAMYSGTMGHKQGLDVLAQAAAGLSDVPNIVFVFCGDGPGRTEFVAQCAGLRNVTFLHLQPPERLGMLLGMADIHLLPQRAGAADLVMPSKLTGMLASGAPVVATCEADSGLAEVLLDCGLVVGPGDADALVSAIRTLAGDDRLRAGLGANARAYAEEHLASDKVLAAFELALQDALSTP